MTVLIVAAPLMARSGVYRSTLDLVRTARAAGHDWHAVVGVRPDAPGTSTAQDGVHEYVATAHGAAVVTETAEAVRPHLDSSVNAVISMVTQSDVAARRALRGHDAAHVAWVRGTPWPAPGEQPAARRFLLRAIAGRTLRQADAVWATTPVLAEHIRRVRTPEIVPAGIPLLDRVAYGETAGPLLWAARLAPAKYPELFLDLARRTGHPARLHGHGPLEAPLRRQSPPSLEWSGWAAPADLWTGDGIATCTSHYEAFGRTPVEAASAGLPVVLADQTGAAPFLVTDPQLRRRFVLPVANGDAWERAIRDLIADQDLRRQLSDHVHGNAGRLSIDQSVEQAVSHLKRL